MTQDMIWFYKMIDSCSWFPCNSIFFFENATDWRCARSSFVSITTLCRQNVNNSMIINNMIILIYYIIKAHYLSYDANTTIENMPRQDWKRAQRRHYNEFKPVNMDTNLQSRDMLLNSTSRNEKRHFGNPSQKSHLDQFFW